MEASSQVHALLRGQLLEVAVGQQPAALLHHGKSWTRHELHDLSQRFAVGLAALPRGATLAIWLPNGPELLALYLACFARGLVPMPLAPGLKWPELLRILEPAHVDGLIVSESALHDHELELMRLSRRAWSLGKNATRLHPLDASPHDATFEGERLVPSATGIDEAESPCLILHTSGSTGHPKGVVLPRRALRHILEYRLTHCELGAESVSVVASCIAQSVGLYQSLALLAVGAQIVLLDSYEIEALVDAVNQHRPSHLIMVVSAFDQLLHHPRITRESLDALRFAAAGADRLTDRVQARFQALTGRVLRASYGLSESSWALVNDGTRADKALALGKPCPGIAIELRAPNGVRVSPGATGEIHIRSPRTMLGYLNDAALTGRVVDAGWLSTGDLAYQDSEGYYWFAGRSKDLIVLASGDNVAPAEIEQVLLTHPAVAACMVHGRLQADGSVLPWAHVVATRSTTPLALRDFLRERLSDYKVPAGIELVSELPVGLSGKIVRTGRPDPGGSS